MIASIGEVRNTSTADFLSLLFKPEDWVTIRLVQSWEDGKKRTATVGAWSHTLEQWLRREGLLLSIVRDRAEVEKASFFFGVNPRACFGGSPWKEGSFDYACHVPLVRNLYADLDTTSPEDAAKLSPTPSIVLASGNGSHVYWRLKEPVVVPHSLCAVYKEMAKGRAVPYHLVDGKRVSGLPSTSPEADRVNAVLVGLSQAIAADHCTDLARLLRLPGIPNYKGWKNGREPRPVFVYAINDVSYDFAEFAKFAATPSPKREKKATSVTVKTASTSVPVSTDLAPLLELIAACEAAEVGQRSEKDYALVARAVALGIEADAVWEAVQNVSKFAERPRERYFDKAWDKALSRLQAADEEFADLDRAVEAQLTAPSTTVNIVDGSPFTTVTATPIGKKKKKKHDYGEMAAAFVDQANASGQPLVYTGGKTYAFARNRFVLCDELPMRVRAFFVASGWPQSNNVVGNVVPIIQSAVWRSSAEFGSMPFWIDGKPPFDPRNTIPFANGLYDLHTGTITPHSPSWCSTVVLPYAYDPKATCSRWQKFLAEVLEDDAERIALLQEYMGYLLTADTSLQKALVLVGKKRGGKGTIQRIVRDVVGLSNCAGFSLDRLASDFGLSALTNASVAIVGEIELSGNPHRSKIVEVWKSVIGEDLQSINEKYNPQFASLKLPTRFLCAANTLPRLMDASGALATRLLFLPFDLSFAGREDPHLYEKLLAELPGIALWAMDGLRRLRSSGGRFTLGTAHKRLAENFSEDTTPILSWLKDCMVVSAAIDPGDIPTECVVAAAVSIPREEAYNNYVCWCNERGIDTAPGMVWFARDLMTTLPKLLTSRTVDELTGKRVRRYSGLGRKTAS